MKRKKQPTHIPTELSQSLTELSVRLANLSEARIFRCGSTVGAIDKKGEISPMTAESFITFVEELLAPTFHEEGRPSFGWLGKHHAQMILASSHFRSQLNELKTLNIEQPLSELPLPQPSTSASGREMHPREQQN